MYCRRRCRCSRHIVISRVIDDNLSIRCRSLIWPNIFHFIPILWIVVYVCCVHLLKCWAVKTFNKTPSSHTKRLVLVLRSVQNFSKSTGTQNIQTNHTHIQRELTKTVRITTMKKTKSKKCEWKQRRKSENISKNCVWRMPKRRNILLHLPLSVIRALSLAPCCSFAVNGFWFEDEFCNVAYGLFTKYAAAHSRTHRREHFKFRFWSSVVHLFRIVFLIFTHSIMMCPMCFGTGYLCQRSHLPIHTTLYTSSVCALNARAHIVRSLAGLSFFTEFRFIILSHLIFGTVVRHFVIFFLFLSLLLVLFPYFSCRCVLSARSFLPFSFSFSIWFVFSLSPCLPLLHQHLTFFSSLLFSVLFESPYYPRTHCLFHFDCVICD